MADTYSKISELSESLYDDVTGEEMIPAAIGTENVFIKISEVAKYILGVVGLVVRAIGSDISGAVVTTDDEQEITNKNLSTGCKVNGGDDISVTSTELNCCSGLTVNVATKIADIENSIGSVVAGLEEALDTIDDFGVTVQNNYKFKKYIIGGTGTATVVNASDISDDKISYENLIINVYSAASASSEKVLTLESSEGIKIYTTTVDGDQILDWFSFPSTPEQSYLIVVYYSLYIE